MLVQIISLVALVIAAGVAPMVERMMSDPDVKFRVGWHLDRFRRDMRRRLNEASIRLESGLGIWQIVQYLRRSHGDKGTMGGGHPAGGGGRAV